MGLPGRRQVEMDLAGGAYAHEPAPASLARPARGRLQARLHRPQARAVQLEYLSVPASLAQPTTGRASRCFTGAGSAGKRARDACRSEEPTCNPRFPMRPPSFATPPRPSRRLPALRSSFPATTRSSTIADGRRGFRTALPQATIYVYDNNSTDRTSEVARQAGAVVRPRAPAGQGQCRSARCSPTSMPTST